MVSAFFVQVPRTCRFSSYSFLCRTKQAKFTVVRKGQGKLKHGARWRGQGQGQGAGQGRAKSMAATKAARPTSPPPLPHPSLHLQPRIFLLLRPHLDVPPLCAHKNPRPRAELFEEAQA